MGITSRLSDLRKLMAQNGLSAYIIVTDDFHGSEYVGDYFKAREFMSGFTGSAGTLVVMKDWAGLWTDGRYFLQAGEQLCGTGIELMKSGEPDVPAIPAFLEKHIGKGGRVGFDGRTVSGRFAKQLEEKLPAGNIELVWDLDLVDSVWSDRPGISKEPVWELAASYAGLDREEKLSRVRSIMKVKKADILILTALDEIAWLLNLRGNDIRCTPVFLAYMLISEDSADLYVHREIISDEIQAKLAASGVWLKEYDDIYGALGKIESGSRVLLDDNYANCRIIKSLPENADVRKEQSPVIPMKAAKNPVEAENIRRAHIKDGVAVTRFIRWLKRNVGGQCITELGAAAQLEKFRSEMENYIGPSFEPIIGYGPHGAIVHYEATKESDICMRPESFCLTDTGGHYLEGTTDITRTIPLGKLTGEEKRAYTLVLKGHLNLAAAKFLYGVSGPNLDYLARRPLWENGMDYNHGTGHGAGYLLNVHEGPQRIHWRADGANLTAFEEGMVVSDEPGLYIEGRFGIRHENLVMVRKGEKTEYGQFMYFENLTMVPFDRDAIDVSLMSEKEKELLNDYHRKVFETISPWFEGEELEWLKNYTAPL